MLEQRLKISKKYFELNGFKARAHGNITDKVIYVTVIFKYWYIINNSIFHVVIVLEALFFLMY